MKKFIEEFKKFALKGNMIDLAVGMIIGSAFTGIVSSLVDDIFMPVLSLFTGKIDFNNLCIVLGEGEGAAMIKYGSFITQVINFLAIAFVVFIFIKQRNKVQELGKKKEEAAPTEKECPYCMSKISIKATKCPHCTSDLSE